SPRRPTNPPPASTRTPGANGGTGPNWPPQPAADGQNLILIAQALPRLKAAADEVSRSVRVHTIAQDLSQPEAAQRVCDQVRALGAEVDCLINNAGFGDYGSFAMCDLAKQQRMIAVNITALTALTRL